MSRTVQDPVRQKSRDLLDRRRQKSEFLAEMLELLVSIRHEGVHINEWCRGGSLRILDGFFGETTGIIVILVKRLLVRFH